MSADVNFSEPSDTNWKSLNEYLETAFGVEIASDCFDSSTNLSEANAGSSHGDIPSTITTLKPLEFGEKMSYEKPEVYLTIEENFDEFQSAGAQIKRNDKDDLFPLNQDFVQHETPVSGFDCQTESQNNLVYSHNGQRDTLEAGKLITVKV